MQADTYFKAGMSFDEFMQTESDESYREKGIEILQSIEFEEKYIKQIANIREEINIIIYGEVWCPDCMINIPVIEKMRTYNDNINLSIFDKQRKIENNIEIEQHISLPTFIVCDKDFQELGVFTEFPSKLKEIIENGNESNVLVNIRKYRKGDYAQETLKDILDMINRRQ